MKNKFTLKKYDDISELILASYNNGERQLTMDELKQSVTTGCDEKGNEVNVTHKQQIDAIKEQGIWGWVDDNDCIHYWYGEDLHIEHLMHFFAHEIGHRTGKPCKDHLKEEMRAEQFAEVTLLAYNFATALL